MTIANDQNKTALTKEVTEAVCGWLAERGCKPIATECEIGWRTDRICWIADVATMVSPTDTELQDLRLIRRKPPWGISKDDRRLENWQGDVEPLRRLYTVAVEVKTSRADFRKDQKWKRERPADLNFLVFPLGLVGDSDWPPGWGVLAFDAPSQRFKYLRVPEIGSISVERQRDFIYAIACRRHNQEVYGAVRDQMRESQSYQNQYTNVRRYTHAMKAALSIAYGEHGSVEGALEYHGVKNVGDLLTEQAKRLWRIARSE